RAKSISRPATAQTIWSAAGRAVQPATEWTWSATGWTTTGRRGRGQGQRKERLADSISTVINKFVIPSGAKRSRGTLQTLPSDFATGWKAWPRQLRWLRAASTCARNDRV